MSRCRSGLIDAKRAYLRLVTKIPTMKPLDSDKKVSKEVSSPAEAHSDGSRCGRKNWFFQCSDWAFVWGSGRFWHLLQEWFPCQKGMRSCEEVKKLLKFVLDDGTGTDRVILSGIHEYYEPEELVGKTSIAITNLPPRAMMGIDSCGMLISAVHHENGEEKLHLLMVDPHIPAGAKLYWLPQNCRCLPQLTPIYSELTPKMRLEFCDCKQVPDSIR